MKDALGGGGGGGGLQPSGNALVVWVSANLQHHSLSMLPVYMIKDNQLCARKTDVSRTSSPQEGMRAA